MIKKLDISGLACVLSTYILLIYADVVVIKFVILPQLKERWIFFDTYVKMIALLKVLTSVALYLKLSPTSTNCTKYNFYYYESTKI